jgi:putative hydrolase of the HAD superfamily
MPPWLGDSSCFRQENHLRLVYVLTTESKMIKGIIFDFDGPIVKSKSWHAVLDEYEEYYKLPTGTVHDLLREYFKVAHKGDCKDMFDYFEQARPASPLDANQLNLILQEASENIVVDRGMVALIEEFKKEYKTALLSNFTLDLMDRLRALKIDHLFDVVVNSSVIKIAKPSPQAFWYTLEQMNLNPSHVVFIDDLPLNIQGAEEVGIKGILYQNFEQAKIDLEKILR